MFETFLSNNQLCIYVRNTPCLRRNIIKHSKNRVNPHQVKLHSVALIYGYSVYCICSSEIHCMFSNGNEIVLFENTNKEIIKHRINGYYRIHFALKLSISSSVYSSVKDEKPSVTK